MYKNPSLIIRQCNEELKRIELKRKQYVGRDGMLDKEQARIESIKAKAESQLN